MQSVKNINLDLLWNIYENLGADDDILYPIFNLENKKTSSQGNICKRDLKSET
jgi:hypothetical protein